MREEEEKENALQFAKAQGENRFVSASVSPQQKMYADAMPKQYSMLAKSGCVILPCYIGLGYPAKDAAVLEQVFSRKFGRSPNSHTEKGAWLSI